MYCVAYVEETTDSYRWLCSAFVITLTLLRLRNLPQSVLPLLCLFHHLNLPQTHPHRQHQFLSLQTLVLPPHPLHQVRCSLLLLLLPPLHPPRLLIRLLLLFLLILHPLMLHHPHLVRLVLLMLSLHRQRFLNQLLLPVLNYLHRQHVHLQLCRLLYLPHNPRLLGITCHHQLEHHLRTQFLHHLRPLFLRHLHMHLPLAREYRDAALPI